MAATGPFEPIEPNRDSLPNQLDFYGTVTYAAVVKPDLECQPSADTSNAVAEFASDSPTTVMGITKPKMRGWLHLGAVPTAALAGLLLVLLAPSQLRIPIAIYAFSTVVLFGISATYHRVNWRPGTRVIMQRIDHSAIFILIAGSYTAVAAAIVTGRSGTVMVIAAWVAATVGVLARLLWVKAPRWVFTPTYILFGVCALFFAPAIIQNGGALVFALIMGGGILYIAGAIIFALRRPDPSPNWFGFHEVFHSFTLGGYVSHYVAVLLAATGAVALR